jgi:hypothetical protein
MVPEAEVGEKVMALRAVLATVKEGLVAVISAPELAEK